MMLLPENTPRVTFTYNGQEHHGYIYLREDTEDKIYISEGRNVGSAQMWIVSKNDIKEQL